MAESTEVLVARYKPMNDRDDRTTNLVSKKFIHICSQFTYLTATAEAIDNNVRISWWKSVTKRMLVLITATHIYSILMGIYIDYSIEF